MSVVGLIKMGAVNLPQNATRYLANIGQSAKTAGNANWNPGSCISVYEMRVNLSEVVPAGNSVIVNVLINDIASGITLTIGAGSSSGSDLAHSITLGNHDVLTVQAVTSATFGNTNDITVTLRCRDFFTGDDCSFGLPHEATGTSPGMSVYYLGEPMSSSTTAAKMDICFAECVLRGTSRATLDIQRNGTTIYTGGDDLDDLYFAPGDRYRLKYTSADGVMVGGCVRFRDPKIYAPLLFGVRDQAQNTTRYMGGHGSSSTPTVNEIEVQIPVPACTIRDMYSYVEALPPAGQTIVHTLRKNGVDTALTCTLTSAGRTACDDTHSVDFLDGDLLSISTTSATTGPLTTSCSVAVVPT